jgi:hypothetical protein
MLTNRVVDAENGGEVLLVPVIVNTSVPAFEPVVIVNATCPLALEFSVTCVVLKLVCCPQAHPLTVSTNVTAPLNPPKLVIVMIDCAVELVGMFSVDGVADRLKPPTKTESFA